MLGQKRLDWTSSTPTYILVDAEALLRHRADDELDIQPPPVMLNPPRTHTFTEQCSTRSFSGVVRSHSPTSLPPLLAPSLILVIAHSSARAASSDLMRPIPAHAHVHVQYENDRSGSRSSPIILVEEDHNEA